MFFPSSCCYTSFSSFTFKTRGSFSSLKAWILSLEIFLTISPNRSFFVESLLWGWVLHPAAKRFCCHLVVYLLSNIDQYWSKSVHFQIHLGVCKDGPPFRHDPPSQETWSDKWHRPWFPKNLKRRRGERPGKHHQAKTLHRELLEFFLLLEKGGYKLRVERWEFNKSISENCVNRGI